jgi:DNA-binding NarL/FixJ family response regulator
MAPADEVWKCPECGSIDRGIYLITPASEGNPLGTLCKNAWHHAPPVPPDKTGDFTGHELQFIFGVCWGLSVRDIAEQYEVREDAVQGIIYQKIFDKAGVSTRMELLVFVRDALNNELKRRRLSLGDSGAAMEG